MELIARLTDATVLGLPGLSHAKPRKTARAVLINSQGLYAVMYAAKFGLYSLPGGGINEGEEPLEALGRELAEETGCLCRDILPLGVVEENRAHVDYTQLSYYYLAHTDGPSFQAQLTQEEQRSATSVQWHTLEKAVQLITGPEHTTSQRKFLQARDRAVLEYYIHHIKTGDAAP